LVCPRHTPFKTRLASADGELSVGERLVGGRTERGEHERLVVEKLCERRVGVPIEQFECR
jgi:hypothetical protein